MAIVPERLKLNNMKKAIKPRYENVKALREAFSTALGIIQELTYLLGNNGIIKVQNPATDINGYFTDIYDTLQVYDDHDRLVPIGDVPRGIWFYSHEALENFSPSYTLQIEYSNRDPESTVYLYFICPVENA